jgi:hypothetical protein
VEKSYVDSAVQIECAVSADGTAIHAGQIWKHKRSKFHSVFVVTSVYERSYQGGKNSRARVKGVLISSGDPQSCDPSRSLDVESLRTMYPFIHFEPYKPRPEEDK